MLNFKDRVKALIDRIIWNIKPRIYICRDVTLIKWFNREFIIKR